MSASHKNALFTELSYNIPCYMPSGRETAANLEKYYEILSTRAACTTGMSNTCSSVSLHPLTRPPPWTERETRSRVFKGGTLRFVSVNLRAATTLMLKSCRDLPKRLLEFLFKRSTSRVKVFYPKTKSEETRERLF